MGEKTHCHAACTSSLLQFAEDRVCSPPSTEHDGVGDVECDQFVHFRTQWNADRIHPAAEALHAPIENAIFSFEHSETETLGAEVDGDDSFRVER